MHGEDCRTWSFLRGVFCAENNHPRTGADKGNLTVELRQSIAMAVEGVGAMRFLPSALNVKVMKLIQAHGKRWE